MQSLGRPAARVAALGLTPVRQPCASTLGLGYRGVSSNGRYSRCSLVPLPELPRFYSSAPKPPSDTERVSPAVGKSSEALSHSSSEPQSPTNDQPPSSSPSSTTPSHVSLHHGGAKEKFSQIMDNLQSRVLTASQTLNEMTGYSSIEKIKSENEALETSLAEAHARLRAARQAYKSSNAKRAATQREVTTLLARKETWSPTDLERFTELYRKDHVLEGEVSAAQESLTEAEADEQSLGQRLNSGILKRYHEEQIWSDRIRRASTWGTWGLMGMNFLLFVVLQFVAEPWKRRRLVRGVVAEEKEVLEEVRGELAAVKAALERTQGDGAPEQSTELAASPVGVEEEATTINDGADPAKLTWGEFIMDPHAWRAAAGDLYSERRLNLQMRDASVLALEGAAAGAAVTLSLFWILTGRP